MPPGAVPAVSLSLSGDRACTYCAAPTECWSWTALFPGGGLSSSLHKACSPCRAWWESGWKSPLWARPQLHSVPALLCTGAPTCILCSQASRGSWFNAVNPGGTQNILLKKLEVLPTHTQELKEEQMLFFSQRIITIKLI